MKTSKLDTDIMDSDIGDLFAAPLVYDDAEAFENRVTGGLRLKLWMRQGLIVLAGFVGGLYALAQLVRVPNWTAGGKSPYLNADLHQAAASTGQTLRAGVEFVDTARQNLGGLATSSMAYLGFMQTPVFFWLSFALCLAFLGLYYAYSQEETI